MSKEVDTKVVEMVFDNKDFESGVKETQKSISGLKNSIRDLSDAADGTESVEKVNRVVIDKMTVVASAVNATVMRLTNNVLDSVHKITHSFDALTVAPISSGFNKYQEQIESVQTIMNATGKSIETVEAQMEKLMWYTDETSYSYTDMASNIGKFTSAGVELEDAVTAMMGIANWAGVSGANVQQASRAMYNLSQAMGTGSLKLQDWMSIENANMATREFKQTLIDTAKELGVLSADTEITAENMRETLKDGWVTRDVLTGALAKYGQYTEDLYSIYQEGAEGVDSAADAMEEYEKRYSGLIDEIYETYTKFGKNSKEFTNLLKKNNLSMQSAMDLIQKPVAEAYNKNLEKIAKNLTETAEKYGVQSTQFAEQAKQAGKTIEEAADIVANGIDKFKMSSDVLGTKSFKAAQEAKTFKDAWEATIDAVSTQWLRLWNAVFGNYEKAKTMWTDLSGVLWDVFASPISDLADMAEMIDELGARDNVLAGLSDAWEHLNAVVEAVKSGIAEVFPVFEDLNVAGRYIYALTVRFKEWAAAVKEGDTNFSQIQENARNVSAVLRSVAEIIFNIGWNIGRIINAILPKKETITKLLTDIFGEAAKIQTVTENITDGVTFVANVIIVIIKILKNIITTAISLAIVAIAGAVDFIIYTFEHLTSNPVFQNLIIVAETIGGAIIYVVEAIWSVLSTMVPGIVKIIEGVADFISKIFDQENFKKYWVEGFNELLGYFQIIKDIFDNAIGLFGVLGRVVNYLFEGIGQFLAETDVWRASFILLVLALISGSTGIVVIVSTVIKKIIDVISFLFSPIKGIRLLFKAFLESIGGMIGDLMSFIDVAKLEAIGHLMLAFGGTVILLSIAAMELSRIKPEVFWTSIKALGALMAFTLAFMLIAFKLLTDDTLKKFKPDEAIKETVGTISAVWSLGLALAGLAAVINALVGLVDLLASVYEAVGYNTTGFFVILGGVALLIAGMFTGILLFSQSLKKIQSVKESETSSVAIQLKNVSGNMTDVALALVAIALALGVLTFVNPDQLKQAAIILGAFFLGLVIVIGIMKAMATSLAKWDKKNKSEGTDMPAAIAYIDAMTEGMKALSGAFAKMALAFWAFSKIPDPSKAILPFSIVAVAALLMIGTFGWLLRGIKSTLDETETDNGGAALKEGKLDKDFRRHTQATGVMAEHIKELGKAFQKMFTSLAVLTASLALLSSFDVHSINAAALAIGGIVAAVLLVFMIFVTLMNIFSNKGNSGKGPFENRNTVGSLKDKTLEVKSDMQRSGFNGTDVKLIADGISEIFLSIAAVAAVLAPLALIIMAEDAWNTLYNELNPENTKERLGVVGRAVGAISEIIGAIIALLVVVGIFFKSRKSDTKSATIDAEVVERTGKMIVKLAAAIAIIAGVIAALAALQLIDGYDIVTPTKAISAILLMMAAFFGAVLSAAKTMTKTEAQEKMSVNALSSIRKILVFLGASVAIIAASISLMAAVAMFSGMGNLIAAAASVAVMLGLYTLFVTQLMKSVGKLISDNANTPKRLEKVNELVNTIGKTMILLATSMAIISAGVALVVGATALSNDKVSALLSILLVFAGIAILFGEMAIFLSLLAGEFKEIQNGPTLLRNIGLSMILMSGAIFILSFAFQQMQKLGSDVLPMVGYFTVIMAVFLAYNLLMMNSLKKLNATNSYASTDLLIIAAQMIIFAVAINMIIPAIKSLMEATNELGGMNLAAAAGVIIGLLFIFTAIEYVLSNIAKSMGANTTTDTAVVILSLSVALISMAGAMWVMSYALQQLASIDTTKAWISIGEVAVLMLTFVVSLAIMSKIAKTSNGAVFDLALTFLTFAAALWLASLALDAFHNTMYNIANDEYIRAYADSLIKDPETLKGTLAVLGTLIGGILITNIVRKITNAISTGISSFTLETLGSLLKTPVGLLGGTLGGWIVAAILGVLATIAVVDTIRRAIEDDWDDQPFYQIGRSIAKAINTGFSDTLDITTSKGMHDEEIIKQFEDQFTYKDLNKRFYEEDMNPAAIGAAMLIGKQKWGKDAYEDQKLIETQYRALYEASIRDYTIAGLSDTFERYRKFYGDKASGMTSKQIHDDAVAKIEKLKQDAHFNAAIWGEIVQEVDERIAKEQEVAKQHELDVANAEYEHQKRLDYIREHREEELAAIKDAGDAQAGNAASREAAQNAEAARAEAMGRQAVGITIADKNAYEATADYKKKKDTEVKENFVENEEEKQAEVEETKATSDDVSEAMDTIVTKQEAENREIAEGNRLLFERLGLTQTIADIQNGSWDGVLQNFLTGDAVENVLSKRFTTWFTGLKNKGLSALGIEGAQNTGPMTIVTSLFNSLTSGLTWDNAKEIAKDLPDFEEGLSKFKEVVGIDFDAIKEFDIKDPIGSLKKIVKIDKTAAASAVASMFGIDTGEKFTWDEFSKKLLGGIDFTSMLGGEDSPFDSGGVGKVNELDWSNVVDSSALSSLGNSTGMELGDYILDGVKTGVNNGKDEYANDITSWMERMAQEQADAYGNALSIAMNAATEKYNLGNNYGKTAEEMLPRADIEAYNVIVEDAEMNNALKKLYKDYTDTYEKRMKALGKQILDENGKYKKTASEADKKRYEEYKAEYEKYKQLYEQQKAFNEQQRKQQDEITKRLRYMRDNEKLENDIEKQRAKVAAWEAKILAGEAMEGIDIMDEYQKALEKLNKLLGIQEEIQQAQKADLEKQEGDEIVDYEDMSQTDQAKAARKALKEQIAPLDEKIAEANKKIEYYETRAKTNNLTQWEKEDLKAAKEERRSLQIERSGLAHQYNNLLDPSRIRGEAAVTGSGEFSDKMVEDIDKRIEAEIKARANGKYINAPMPYQDYITRLWHNVQDKANKVFNPDGTLREGYSQEDYKAWQDAKKQYDDFMKIVNEQGIYGVRAYFATIRDTADKELQDTKAIAYAGEGLYSASETEQTPEESLSALGIAAGDTTESLKYLTPGLDEMKDGVSGLTDSKTGIPALNSSIGTTITDMTSYDSMLKGQISDFQNGVSVPEFDTSKLTEDTKNTYSAITDGNATAMNTQNLMNTSYIKDRGYQGSMFDKLNSANEAVGEQVENSNTFIDKLTELSNTINEKLDSVLVNQSLINGGIEAFNSRETVDYSQTLGDISDKLDTISEPQGVYIDSKALVGKIGPAMDKTLGIYARRSK